MSDPENKRITREFYEESDYFDRHLSDFLNVESHFQRYRIRNVLEIHTPKSTDTVLDLGCGWGTFAVALAGGVNKIIGIDISEKSIQICRRVAEAKNLTSVEFMRRDCRDTGLGDESIDVVVCADLVEHIYPKTYEEMLEEMRRLLRRGGRFIIWTPHRGHLFEILKNRNIILKRDISHVDYKSMERLTSSLEAHGFKIVKAYYKESHLPVFSFFEKAFLRFLPFCRRRIAVLGEKL